MRRSTLLLNFFGTPTLTKDEKVGMNVVAARMNKVVKQA